MQSYAPDQAVNNGKQWPGYWLAGRLKLSGKYVDEASGKGANFCRIQRRCDLVKKSCWVLPKNGKSGRKETVY